MLRLFHKIFLMSALLYGSLSSAGASRFEDLRYPEIPPHLFYRSKERDDLISWSIYLDPDPALSLLHNLLNDPATSLLSEDKKRQLEKEAPNLNSLRQEMLVLERVNLIPDASYAAKRLNIVTTYSKEVFNALYLLLEPDFVSSLQEKSQLALEHIFPGYKSFVQTAKELNDAMGDRDAEVKKAAWQRHLLNAISLNTLHIVQFNLAPQAALALSAPGSRASLFIKNLIVRFPHIYAVFYAFTQLPVEDIYNRYTWSRHKQALIKTIFSSFAHQQSFLTPHERVEALFTDLANLQQQRPDENPLLSMVLSHLEQERFSSAETSLWSHLTKIIYTLFPQASLPKRDIPLTLADPPHISEVTHTSSKLVVTNDKRLKKATKELSIILESEGEKGRAKGNLPDILEALLSTLFTALPQTPIEWQNVAPFSTEEAGNFLTSYVNNFSDTTERHPSVHQAGEFDDLITLFLNTLVRSDMSIQEKVNHFLQHAQDGVSTQALLIAHILSIEDWREYIQMAGLPTPSFLDLLDQITGFEVTKEGIYILSLKPTKDTCVISSFRMIQDAHSPIFNVLSRNRTILNEEACTPRALPPSDHNEWQTFLKQTTFLDPSAEEESTPFAAKQADSSKTRERASTAAQTSHSLRAPHQEENTDKPLNAFSTATKDENEKVEIQSNGPRHPSQITTEVSIEQNHQHKGDTNITPQ